MPSEAIFCRIDYKRPTLDTNKSKDTFEGNLDLQVYDVETLQ